MRRIVAFASQLLLYALFGSFLGYFATRPPYAYSDPGSATLKLSLSHAAELASPCVPLTPEEIAALAANMRRSETCERERLPLRLELDIDGQRALDVAAQPSGLWHDGPGSVYERLEIEPGEHHVAVRLRDSSRTSGWDFEHAENVTIEPGRYFTITFRAENGGFRFR